MNCATRVAGVVELDFGFGLHSFGSKRASENHGCTWFTQRARGPLLATALVESATKTHSGRFMLCCRRSCSADLCSSFQLGNKEAWRGSGVATKAARERECFQAVERGPQELSALDVQLGRASKWSLLDDVHHQGLTGAGTSVTTDVVCKLCRQGKVRQAVEAMGVLGQAGCVSQPLLYTVLKECVATKDLVLGRLVHGLVVWKGYDSDTFLCNHILRMYASHGKLQEAMDVFTMVSKPDAFTWSAIISAHVKYGQAKQAIHLYHEMRASSVRPDCHVFVAVLQACAREADLKTGQEVHAHVLTTVLEPDLFVCNALVHMYAKCGSLEEAQRVFDGIPDKDVAIWNALISGYSQQGNGEKALRLYRAMQEEGIAAPDSVTFVCLLQACASVGILALETGKQLHAQIGEHGLQADVCVANSLVNMYVKCGSLEDAQGVFDRLGMKDVVTWNAMIAGYSQQGMGQEALGLYRALQQEGAVAPDSVTFACLLQSCANVAALHLGRQLHVEIRQQGLQADVFLAISLINMYAKCGSMVDAQQVFDELPERSLVAWNALIAGYAHQANAQLVFDLLHRMQEDGIQPDDITFISVLTVCSHVGLVTEGQEYFEAMSRCHGIAPTTEHYSCMVALLARAGQLDNALAVVQTMPVQPQDAVWHTLLGACRKWRNVEVGRHAFDEALKRDKKNAAAYVSMSNIYTGAQMWEEAEDIQARRKGVGAWKQPGQSWWTDMDGVVHSFLVPDKEHPESDNISELVSEMKEKWRVPLLDSSWEDILDEKLICLGTV